MQMNKKRLNIIAIRDASPYGEAAVSHATILSSIFDASLTIITNFSFAPKSFKEFRNKKHLLILNQDIWKEEIGQIHAAIDQSKATVNLHFSHPESDSSDYNVETVSLDDHFTATALYQYAEETNTVMFVIGVSVKGEDNFFSRKKAVQFIRPSRIPVMTVGKNLPDTAIYKQVILPLDIARNAKEKSMWAGYFSRFYQAVVHVLYTSYKDEFLEKKMKTNVLFTEKLYKNLEIQYELHHIMPTIDNMDRYSIEYASQIAASLTIIVMTKYFSLFDLLFGPKEYTVIGNQAGLPVLCINEREDLYVLCT
jgi:hypothetical protein